MKNSILLFMLMVVFFLPACIPSSSPPFCDAVNTEVPPRQRRELDLQFLLVTAAGIQKGWNELNKLILGKRNNGEYSECRIDLPNKNQYQMFAICDKDCPDIDLWVYEQGNLVGSDTKPDSLPVVGLKSGGHYLVKLRMTACKKDPCYYRVGVLGK